MEKYEILEQISDLTYKVARKSNNAFFALKTISYIGLSKAEKKRIVDTINTLIQLHCVNTVRYHNCIVDSDKGTLNLITDFYEGGNLEQLIRKHVESQQPFDEEQIWSIAADIALALYECHNNKHQKIIHGALTPDHILFDSEGNARIGCFSLDRCMSGDTEHDLTDLGKLIFEMATLSKAEPGHHSFQSKLKSTSEGISEVVPLLLGLSPSKFTLLNFLEFPEVALKVLEKKVKLETAFYEQEKAKYLALEASFKQKDKIVASQDANISFNENEPANKLF
ncbi:hypothetical protein M9Y10_043118 [Tritrichomonas musculus]|uniref:non-specific serine/threonine protein kinase n=1 Tax=Tritrichomonas musculus TaxID=1915356 RepID=A0ABR2K1Q5_9EUKA